MFPRFFSIKQQSFFVKEGNSYVAGNEKAPVINDIPRFVDSSAYASLFGDQWKRYKKTQLDSYSGLPITKKRLERCMGPSLMGSMTGKLVLEAGCGAGRFTEVLLDKNADLISSDLSNAVEVNQENCPQNEKHIIIQADINNMPFQPGTFDVVVCLGVIQHTPDSKKAIEALYRLVKQGGTLVIDHYSFENSNFLRTAPLFRRFLKKKDAEYTIKYCERLVKKYLPWYKRFRKSRFITMIMNRFIPVISYYRVYPELNDQLQQEWAFLDTHDSLTDWYKRYLNKEEVTNILTELGGKDIWCEYGGNGVEARCVKPQ